MVIRAELVATLDVERVPVTILRTSKLVLGGIINL